MLVLDIYRDDIQDVLKGQGRIIVIKILFFIPTLSGGGAEKVLLSLVNNMDQEKFDITVQTIEYCNPEQFLVEGIRYKAINRCNSKWGKSLFTYWFRLCAGLNLAYRFFVKDNYDIEIAYLETIATKIIAQSTNNKAKRLAWVHCDLSKKEGIEKNVNKIRRQYRRFDKIICVSEDVRLGFHKLLGQDFDTIVMKNVIDDAEILEKAKELVDWDGESDVVQLMAVGRLSKEKNYIYLIETCGRLKEKGLQFHLNILGGGPEKKNLIRIIQELGLDGEVTLRGPVNNPYSWMRKADVIVCSSQYEGLSTVIQEAIILGKAIVTTPCGGMIDLLGKSEYGMIVDSSENGLFNGLYKMINSKELRLKYSQKARERSCLFTKESVIHATQEFLINELYQGSEGGEKR